MIEQTFIQEVTIEMVDQAAKDWFDKTVDSFVQFPNGDRKKVPVIISSGERAITSRQRKGIRDSNGLLILPLISIRRTGIAPRPDMQALGTETEKLVVSRQISRKTNALMNLYETRLPVFKTVTKPAVFEVITIPFPNSTIFSYELMIQAQYIVQMNQIIEKIFNQLELQKTFVAPFENNHRHPPDGHGPFPKDRELIKGGYVVGFFDNDLNDSSNFEEFTDQERIIRYTVPFTIPATLQLDPEGERPAVQKEYTSFDLRFANENTVFVDDPYDIELIFNGK